MLQCSHCSKEFRYNSERKRHELSHFPHFECKTCSKKFSFISALRRHQKQHERTDSVRCEECKRKFRDDVLLKRHIKYAHKGTFICEKCNSKFSSELALRTHTKTHRPEAERRFKCSHNGCTKTFNFSHHLKHHILTHTNAKQHYCSFCGKGFIQSHHLKTHMKAHDPAGWLFCKSPGCKKKFTTNYARKRHMTTHTQKNKPDSGISSDSDLCDASNSSKNFKESTQCATCGEVISQNDYETHSIKCARENTEITAISENEDSHIVEDWPNSPFKPNDFKDDSIKEKFTGDCDTIDSCDVNYNKNYIDNVNSVNDEPNAGLQYHNNFNSQIVNSLITGVVKVSSVIDFNQNSEKDMCEGCDCANICNAKVSMYDITPNSVELLPKIDEKDRVTPNIEYGIDGVIKIKDPFDDDILMKTEKDVLGNTRFIPFSTCKDAIGNCLMSGGDGCLCARMMVNEDQAIMAQEIDDITPQPKIEPL